MNEVSRLIEKHRANGLLIDANLLVLYLIGKTNQNRIAKFDRTQQFTIAEFRMLERFVNQFRRIVTTPHVLTEVSNLARLRGTELKMLRTTFREIMDRSREIYDESRAIAFDASFLSLGLTDAAISMAARHEMLVLTDDLDLYWTLGRRGIDVINFNHIRWAR
jgi:rRNA-processing protein FCF1